MANLQTFKDHFVVLCEAGFIAVNQADEDAARKLFRASMLLEPKSTLPKVGMGYMHLMKLELSQACKMFQEVLTEEPSNEMAKTFLGLSYALTATDVATGEALLQEVVSHSHADETSQQVEKLASSCLEFIEKHIKKGKTSHKPEAKPASPKKKKEK